MNLGKSWTTLTIVVLLLMASDSIGQLIFFGVALGLLVGCVNLAKPKK